MSVVCDVVKKSVQSIIEKLGYSLIDIEYKKKSNGMNLTIFIDKKGGVSLNDCEIVHNAIDKILDELDPTQGESYFLNVSSPGLDRNLNSDVLLSLNIGEFVDISLYEKIGKKKNFENCLIEGFDDKNIYLLYENNKINIDRKLISKINKHIDLGGLLKWLIRTFF